jgi:ABC-type antimicrobial peptide transport system permease subunit
MMGNISKRTRELGIRIALGAQPRQIYRLILQNGVAPVIVGAIAGIGLASMLPAIRATRIDPVQALRAE